MKKQHNLDARKAAITDTDVEKEIAELSGTEEVALSKAEERIKYRRRQYLYQLRWHYRRGVELKKQGYTLDMLKEGEGNERE